MHNVLSKFYFGILDSNNQKCHMSLTVYSLAVVLLLSDFCITQNYINYGMFNVVSEYC